MCSIRDSSSCCRGDCGNNVVTCFGNVGSNDHGALTTLEKRRPGLYRGAKIAMISPASLSAVGIATTVISSFGAQWHDGRLDRYHSE
jgi:hypothetical protein